MLILGVLFLLLPSVAPQNALAQIKGVNLGGWLVSEKWMTPSVYGGTDATDEWTLCERLGKVQCAKTLGKHWNTFINRTDFQDISNAGLNTVRIPIGYWAVDLLDFEPYVAGQFSYLRQAVEWARDLGLGVVISLHGAPGSQNGQSNSGYAEGLQFARNSSNVDRTLKVITNFTEEFSQQKYNGAVQSIEVLNEPRLTSSLTKTVLTKFYETAVQAAGSTIKIAIHDSFQPLGTWTTSSFASADKVLLDTHQYYAFPPKTNFTRDQILDSICNISKALKQDAKQKSLPPTMVGEWSLATSQSQGSPTKLNNTSLDNEWLQIYFEAQIAAYSPNAPGQISTGWIFWSWRTENDVKMWSYRRGLREGYIPSNISDESLLKYTPSKHGCVSGAAVVKPDLLLPVLMVVIISMSNGAQIGFSLRSSYFWLSTV